MINVKKALCSLTAALLLSAPLTGSAAEMTWEYNADSACVLVKGYGMINDAAPFTQYLKTAKKIQLIKGVTKIEKNVFSDCGIVEEVVLPEGFVSIGSNAFSFSKKLKTINFPDTLEYIGDEAFMDCPELESVEIPQNVSYIGTNAFVDCNTIESFSLSEENPNYTAVDGVIFSKDKTELVMYPAGRKDESYTIPDGTVKISSKAFSYNTKLKSVKLPDTVKEIGDYAFYFCEELKNAELGKALESIGDYAFYGSGVRNAILPYGCISIGSDVYKNCEFLISADIPGTVSKIGKNVFFGTDDSLKIRGYGNAAAECAAEAEKSFEETVRIMVDGNELQPDRPAFIANGFTMVPMRSIFEALGASVEWDGASQTAYAKRGDTECSFRIGENILYKNGQKIQLSAPAVLTEGRTLVHVRGIAEAFGENVDWNGETGLVTITKN